MTTFKIMYPICSKNYTYINEYYNGQHYRSWRVNGQYHGGDIVDFMNRNERCMTYFNYNISNQLSLF